MYIQPIVQGPRLTEENLKSMYLAVAIWDQDTGSNDDFMAGVRLQCSVYFYIVPRPALTVDRILLRGGAFYQIVVFHVLFLVPNESEKSTLVQKKRLCGVGAGLSKRGWSRKSKIIAAAGLMMHFVSSQPAVMEDRVKVCTDENQELKVSNSYSDGFLMQDLFYTKRRTCLLYN